MKRALLIFFLLLAVFTLADENVTNQSETNATTEMNESPEFMPLSFEENTTVNETPLENSSMEEEPAMEMNVTEIPEPTPQIANFTLVNIIPGEFRLGAIQFNVQIENTGNVVLTNLAPVITGKGFALTDIVPIDILRPEEKSYVLVMGEARQAGVITLSIRVQDKLFTWNISVVDPDAAGQAERVKQMEAEASAKEAVLQIFASQLSDLKTQHDEIETSYRTKLKENYDVSDIELETFEDMLRDAEAGLIAKDVVAVNASLTLAREEFVDQKERLDNAVPIKRTFVEKIQDNFLLLSTLAGALITFVTLWEIVKKQKDNLYEKIKEVQVNEDTKIEVKRRRKSKKVE